MENLLNIIVAISAIGFGVLIYFLVKLFKEQQKTNDNLNSNNLVLQEIKKQLEKLETVEKEGLSISKEGFNQMEKALKETINLD